MKKALPIERRFRANPPNLRPALFWFDGGDSVPGWSIGEYENNSAVPLFDESQIEGARAALKAAGIRTDFNGDILEVYGDDDALEEHEAITFQGKRYWQLDGFTWNESFGMFKVGDRVRLVRAVERYPHFTAPAGTTGTVEFVGDSAPGPSAGVTLTVKADRKIRGAEEWNNEIEWAYDDDPSQDLELISGGRAVRESRRVRADQPLNIPGWSNGYDPEISAFAATKRPSIPDWFDLPRKKDWRFVMTTPEDREIRSLDDEVTVGLHHLTTDGDWEMIAYQDFPDVAHVLKINDGELWLIIEHGLSDEEARAMLREEVDDWRNGGPESVLKPIFEDAGLDPDDIEDPEDERASTRHAREDAADQLDEQIRNASIWQILGYMNARSEALNE